MSKSLSATNNSATIDSSGFFNRTKITQILQISYGSDLNILLNSLIDDHEETDDQYELTAETEEKLTFNNVGFYREEIEDFSSYLSIIEERIDSIDNERPGTKNKILKSILSHYKTERKNLLINQSVNHNDKDKIIEEIRNNSDKILLKISEKIIEYAKKDLINTEIEKMRALTNMILCYGFVNCKILENPNDYS